MDPVLDSIDINTVGLIVFLLFLPALVSVLLRLFLQSLQLLDFLTDHLICLLEIVLQLKDGLVFILNTLLVSCQIFVGIRFELGESFLAEFLFAICSISFLLNLSQLNLHGLQT